MAKKHNERCKACKKAVEEILAESFGEVKVNYNLDLPSKVDGYKNSIFAKVLIKIYRKLQKHRGHNQFVKAKKLPNVDFFVPNPGFIVEFDESQHFSRPREITLANYPDALKLGFDKSRWKNLCRTFNVKDNDPPYRNEQRAWYDTLRDFAPSILKLKPTKRLFARDFAWCSLDPQKTADRTSFMRILLNL